MAAGSDSTKTAATETAGADGETSTTGEPDIGGLPAVGDVIAEKYRVDRIIGRGGMGLVVAVTHLTIGEPYAIKFLLPERAKDPELRARFLREARASVRIKSEHVARVTDVAQLPDGAPFIVMEYLSGDDLAAVLRREGPLPIAVAVGYVLQACEGVAEAHAFGFVHRDLKPSNLFLSRRSDGPSIIKVLDFGIAKSIDDAGSHDTNLTETNAIFGSTSYMSPEQTRSTRTVDFRTDVWALGIILYELTAARRPFQGETTLSTLVSIAADQPDRLRDLRPEVSVELDAIVMRCLEKDVADRFQSVAELADALAPFAAPETVSLGRIRRLERAPSRDRARAGESIAARPSARASSSRSVGSGVAKRSGRWKLVGAALAVAAVAIAIAVASTSIERARVRARPAAGVAEPKAPIASEPAPSSAQTPAPAPSAAPSAAALSATPSGAAPAPPTRPTRFRPVVVPSAVSSSRAAVSFAPLVPVAPVAAPAPSSSVRPKPRDPAEESH